MSQFKDAALGDTVYFWFAANATTGAANDGATPLYDVRLAGATAGAAPVYSGTPTLLTHTGYTDGLYEISIAATEANGFAAGNEYAVFCSLTISSVNPAGFCGSVKLVASGKTLHAVASAIKDKLPSKSYLTGTANSDGDIQADEATGNFPGTVAKSPSTLAAADVTGNLPANVLQWSGGALPTIGTSTLTAQQVWEYATRTLSAFGFGVTVTTNNDKSGYTLTVTPPTAAAIADAVWDEAISGHLTAGSTGNALNAAGSAGDPWSTPLPGAYEEGTAGYLIGNNMPSPGSGSTAWSYQLKDDRTKQPIAGAAIRVSTDVAGTITVAAGTTDANGYVTFNLDPGTYYIWRTKTRYTFTDPDVEVVS